MTHPLLAEINRIRLNPDTEPVSATPVKLSAIPWRPMPTQQRQRLILQYMNNNQTVELINLIRNQVESEEYWGNRND